MEDAWCLIFGKLQAVDIASCRLVCRNWKYWITRSKSLNRYIPVHLVSIYKIGDNAVECFVTVYVNDDQDDHTRKYIGLEKIWKFSTKKLNLQQTSGDDIRIDEAIEMELLKNIGWLRDIESLEYESHHPALLPKLLTTLTSLERLTLFPTEETPRYHLTTLLKSLPPLEKIDVIRSDKQSIVIADDTTLDILSKSSQVVPLKTVSLQTIRRQFSFPAVKKFLENAKFEDNALIFLGILDVTRIDFHNYMRSKLHESLQIEPLYSSYCDYHKHYPIFWYDEWEIDENGERQFAYSSCKY